MSDASPLTPSLAEGGFPKRIFSGIQPSGGMTLGNYLGAIRNWVTMQAEFECVYCVVDWHAITASFDAPESFRTATREMAASLIACGIDPEKHILFNQSQNPDHVELAWIFNCVARMGWLNRMTQFKEKAGKNRENASTGLFVYPNLMAADILAYKATHVPVGDDQRQHLELTRDIAQKFNHDFDRTVFPIVEPLILGAATRVMSLRDGTKKMSKSDASDMSRINLRDDSDTIAAKIRKAKTDPEALPSEPEGLAGRPEAENLANIYAALRGVSLEEALREVGGKQFSEFKPILADIAIAIFAPIAESLNRMMADPAEIDRILAKGAERARAVSNPVLTELREVIGFVHG